MHPRERVLMALNREEPDRCPFQSTFTPEFARRLREDMKLQDFEHNPHGGGNTYDLERALFQDMLLTSVGWANSYYQGEGHYRDEWGIGWKSIEYTTKYGKGIYTEIDSHPLSSAEDVISYRPPDPNRESLYTEAQHVIDTFQEEYFIVGVTVTTIFETAWALRGFEQLLIDFLTDPPLSKAILNIPYQYHLIAAKRLVEMGVDMIWIGDDVGMQNRMLISPDLFREYLKPMMATLIQEVKSINQEVKVAYHSDGNIYPIIPDLIEIGLDVLNPIQPSSMDPLEIKKKYGKNLSFWGTIDEQHTLPFGTPEDVRREVWNRLEGIGEGGGLIISPTHHVQLDTPLENFYALVETVHKTPYSAIG